MENKEIDKEIVGIGPGEKERFFEALAALAKLGRVADSPRLHITTVLPQPRQKPLGLLERLRDRKAEATPVRARHIVQLVCLEGVNIRRGMGAGKGIALDELGGVWSAECRDIISWVGRAGDGGPVTYGVGAKTQLPVEGFGLWNVTPYNQDELTHWKWHADRCESYLLKTGMANREKAQSR